MKSASNVDNTTLISKISYSFELLKMRLKPNNSNSQIIPWNDIDEYEYLIKKYYPEAANNGLFQQKVLEIGYGARPWRLICLMSLGIDAWGVDLDKPVYGFNFFRLLGVLRNNGIERFSKSFIRGLFFDIHDLKKIKKELLIHGKQLKIDKSRLKVGNAADEEHFEANSFSFAFSEDVFEHIP
ncbi:MAG: hypothetical protein QM541_01040 [Flavobacterium sp.]|nr:hypothetical protein [Flavobacterium sp.]